MLSDPFTITNGTRQGCPLSPLIFALLIELLAESIGACSAIKGLTIGQEEHTIRLYADYILLALTDPLSSIPALQHILKEFGSISLYKVNVSKSFMLPLQLSPSLQKQVLSVSSFSWAHSSQITYLGIKLTSAGRHNFRTNYSLLISKLSDLSKSLTKVTALWAGKISNLWMKESVCFQMTG